MIERFRKARAIDVNHIALIINDRSLVDDPGVAGAGKRKAAHGLFRYAALEQFGELLFAGQALTGVQGWARHQGGSSDRE